MKMKYIAPLLLISLSTYAAPKPLEQDIILKSGEFSKKIYLAIEAKVPLRTASTQVPYQSLLTVPGILTCSKISFRKTAHETDTTYSCRLLKEGWRKLGENVYGSGAQQEATRALFRALSVPAKTEEDLRFKTIEVQTQDPQGGTKKSMLSCSRVSKEAQNLGLRDNCWVIDAL
jgi:hypothetical protein